MPDVRCGHSSNRGFSTVPGESKHLPNRSTSAVAAESPKGQGCPGARNGEARERRAVGTVGASPRGQVGPAPRGRILQATHEHLAHFVALEFIRRPYGSGKGHRLRCIAGQAQPASPRPSTSPSTSLLLRRAHGQSTSPGGLQWEPRENRASAFVSAVRRKAARGCSRPRRAVRRASPTGARPMPPHLTSGCSGLASLAAEPRR